MIRLFWSNAKADVAPVVRMVLLLGVFFTALPYCTGESLSERFSRRHLFHVVGQDYESVQYVGQLADQCVRLGEDYLALPDNPPQPVVVKLFPEAETEWEAPYIIRPQANGGVHVWIRWGQTTQFDTVAEALASGMLQRTAIWHYGLEAGESVPDWLKMAFGGLLSANVRPATIDQQRSNALAYGALPVSEIVESSGPYELDYRERVLNAVWFFRFLESAAGSNQHFRRVCAAFLANLEPISILVKGYPDTFTSMEELNLWWDVGFQATVRGRQTPFYDMEESRQRIQRLAFVAFQDEGEERREAGAELWAAHQNARLKAAVASRIREIKLQIQKINPVYFNALLSLGLVYDALLAEDEAAFRESLGQFVLDFATAQRLEVEIRRLLRW